MGVAILNHWNTPLMQDSNELGLAHSQCYNANVTYINDQNSSPTTDNF